MGVPIRLSEREEEAVRASGSAIPPMRPLLVRQGIPIVREYHFDYDRESDHGHDSYAFVNSQDRVRVRVREEEERQGGEFRYPSDTMYAHQLGIQPQQDEPRQVRGREIPSGTAQFIRQGIRERGRDDGYYRRPVCPYYNLETGMGCPDRRSCRMRHPRLVALYRSNPV
eukprot:CAMPEP_0184697494 /NCGR_PEP_ID=MMETSP0313-20130426/4452_1 /TAXON_ID=2792 /ORGANISM="Porphyridium aerugineum, Strain SAG 1380-2" /LENGTH=168 /DNA_ID=CAMNT_0027156301 /DNA_START=69 /DNA_END=575 /DNA_ORIENTATION=-